MEIGIIIVLTLCLGGCVGYIVSQKTNNKDVHVAKQMTEDELKEKDRLMKHFNGLMNYDAKQAYKAVKR